MMGTHKQEIDAALKIKTKPSKPLFFFFVNILLLLFLFGVRGYNRVADVCACVNMMRMKHSTHGHTLMMIKNETLT